MDLNIVLKMSDFRAAGVFGDFEMWRLITELQPATGGREVVEQIKYLGVIFESNLTFRDHVKKISNIVKF